MFQFKITNSEFILFREFIYDYAGINLGDEKKMLVTSRLGKRLRHYSLKNFRAYFELINDTSHAAERQVAIDLLTTNETYFFREPKHFKFLKKEVLSRWSSGKALRVWSAASSSGEEAYSIAMLLDDVLENRPWEVFGSDISSRVLKRARQGHYLQSRIDGIPEEYLRKYCLKGVGEHEGTLLINKALRKRVRFSSVNLKKSLEEVGFFEVIFLRNVLIYFDFDTKRNIIKQLIEQMQPRGYLFVGHSESLKGIHEGLEFVAPAVYQKI
ncbi:MAG TPA: protein-glutamate O-methyltransferase CheR [Gammaproteobacteria bacterium]|nr:protein-glutamate O-methyltransferase CheR [Gammaproteobacteria bacterium]